MERSLGHRDKGIFEEEKESNRDKDHRLLRRSFAARLSGLFFECLEIKECVGGNRLSTARQRPQNKAKRTDRHPSSIARRSRCPRYFFPNRSPVSTRDIASVEPR